MVNLMLARPALFLSSYAPLFLMLALRFELQWLSWACVGLCIAGVCALVCFFKANRSSRIAELGRVQSVSNAGASASAYLAGYLLPFVTVGTPTALDLVAYAIFFIVAYFVNAKTGLLQVNPLVFMMPHRSIQSITFDGGKVYLVVAYGRVRVGDEIRLQAVGDDDVYMMVRS